MKTFFESVPGFQRRDRQKSVPLQGPPDLVRMDESDSDCIEVIKVVKQL
jgi:hypothetical protein